MDVSAEVGELRFLLPASVADALERAEELRIVSYDDPEVCIVGRTSRAWAVRTRRSIESLTRSEVSQPRSAS